MARTPPRSPRPNRRANRGANAAAGGPDPAALARVKRRLAERPAGPPAETAGGGIAVPNAGKPQFPSSPANTDWRNNIAMDADQAAGITRPPEERWNDALAGGPEAGAGPSPSEAVAQHEEIHHPRPKRPRVGRRGPPIT